MSVSVLSSSGAPMKLAIGVPFEALTRKATIWVAVGGRGTLSGAILGAVLVNFGKTWFTGALPEYWLYALGALFILVTLFLPKGVMGLFAAFGRKPAPMPPAQEHAR